MLIRSRIIVLTLFLLCLFVPITSAVEKKDSAAPKSTVYPQQTDKAAKPALNAITEAAVKAGVKSCKDRINQVSEFLTAGTNSGWLIMLDKSQPDQTLVSVSMEAATKDVATAYVSESFAPNQASGCAGMYETVVYWEAGCPDVAKKQFSTFKKAGVLSKNISILDGGTGVRVFLMPAGKGCVAIKKEVMQ